MPSQHPWDENWVANEPKPLVPYAIRMRRARARFIWCILAVLALVTGALWAAPRALVAWMGGW